MRATFMLFFGIIQNIINLKKYVKERIFADDGDSRVDLAIKSNSVFYLIDQLVEFFMRVQFIPNQPANLPDQHPNPSDTI